MTEFEIPTDTAKDTQVEPESTTRALLVDLVTAYEKFKGLGPDSDGRIDVLTPASAAFVAYIGTTSEVRSTLGVALARDLAGLCLVAHAETHGDAIGDDLARSLEMADIPVGLLEQVRESEGQDWQGALVPVAEQLTVFVQEQEGVEDVAGRH